MNEDANSRTGSAVLDGICAQAAGSASALLMLSDLVLMLPDIPKREGLMAAEAYATMAACAGLQQARNSLAAIKFLRSEDYRADNPDLAEGYWWGAADLMYPAALAGDFTCASMLLEGLALRADLRDEDAGVCSMNWCKCCRLKRCQALAR